VRESLASACHDPARQQTEFLAGLVTRIAGSAFARAHGLELGSSAAEFRARVPIRTVADFQDYVYRAYDGEPDVLFPGLAIFFAQTSGTTGRPKLIAFSPHTRSVARTFILSTLASSPEELSAFGVAVVGKFEEAVSPAGVPVGGAAGFHRRMLADVPCYGAIPDALAELTDAEARTYGILRILLGLRLLHLTTLNPATTIGFFDQLRRCGAELAADLRDGGIERGPAIVRDALRGHALAPAPERADRLETWLRSGAAHVTTVWPELQRVTTWQEGSFALYLPRLAAQLPGVTLRRMPLGASEGHGMTTPPSGIEQSIPSLLCAYYEFLPIDDEVDPSRLRTIEELELDTEYRIVISNDRGLYRALTEDVFRVVGFEGRVPYLLFVRRHGQTSSLTGEKLTEVHAAAALAAGIQRLSAYPRGTQIVPEWRDDGPPRYAVTLEVAAIETTESLVGFLAAVEATLRDQNLEYVAKRDSKRLAPPILLQLQAGSFERLRIAMTAARNRGDAQYKLLSLAGSLLDRTTLEIERELELD
jgi:hypothetical protein